MDAVLLYKRFLDGQYCIDCGISAIGQGVHGSGMLCQIFDVGIPFLFGQCGQYLHVVG